MLSWLAAGISMPFGIVAIWGKDRARATPRLLHQKLRATFARCSDLAFGNSARLRASAIFLR
jgi:hypothetical protein